MVPSPDPPGIVAAPPPVARSWDSEPTASQAPAAIATLARGLGRAVAPEAQGREEMDRLRLVIARSSAPNAPSVLAYPTGSIAYSAQAAGSFRLAE
jgi:hypothetical protein